MCRWFLVDVFGSRARLLFALCINLSCASEWKLAKFMWAGRTERQEELHFCHVHTWQSMWFAFKLQLHFIVGKAVANKRVLKLMCLCGNRSSTLKYVHKLILWISPTRHFANCDTLTGIAFQLLLPLPRLLALPLLLPQQLVERHDVRMVLHFNNRFRFLSYCSMELCKCTTYYLF